MTVDSGRYHVVCRVGDADPYAPTIQPGEHELPLLLQGSGRGAVERVHETIWRALDRYRLDPHPLAVDFYRAAAAVYAADARVIREDAFDRWTRDLVLHLPVSDLDAWIGVRHALKELLEFLTGDRWDIMLRAQSAPRPAVDMREWEAGGVPEIDAVCLLSGGLDSFVGALDALASGTSLLLVSHNAAGSARFSSPAQDSLQPALERVAGGRVAHLKATVSPPQLAEGDTSEVTQRSRSIIFMGLGVIAASAYPGGTPLIVPENGFISLNVPMTYGRLGSLSTRTTHPYTVELVRTVFDGLGLKVPLMTPYQFATKGQMLLACAAPPVLREFDVQTSSCARPNDRNADPARRQGHCGYCVPCIVRRAAMNAAGLDDARQYRFDVHAERGTLLSSPDRRKDLWAFEMALARAERRVSVTDVLRAGPLPRNAADVERHVKVYRDGLNEVSEFLRGRPVVGAGAR